MSRPDNFEFAMDFVGGEEEASVRAYVERLEQQRDQLLAALRDCVLVMERDLEGLKVIQQELNGARAAIAAVEPPKAAADGWIEWKGGECPVDGGVRVEVRCRVRNEVDVATADDWYWLHDGDDSDIIAYRVVQEGDA